MFQFSTGIFILLSFTSYNNGFLIGQGRSNTVGLLLSSWTPPMKGKELQNKQTKSQFHKDKFHRKGDISIWKITTLFWNMKSSVKKGIWLKRAEVITWASPKRDAKKKKKKKKGAIHHHRAQERLRTEWVPGTQGGKHLVSYKETS